MSALGFVRSEYVVVGVDTHKHIHVAAVLDTVGGVLATLTLPTDTGGFKNRYAWAGGFGKVLTFGIEGAGSYGATLTSFLRRHGHKVVEAGRPDRRARRQNGKSDTLDAGNAARYVLAGFATAIPKTADSTFEMIRQLRIVHDSAVTDRSASMVSMKAMLVRADDTLRRETNRMTPVKLARHLAAPRPGRIETPTDSLRHALWSRARRWQNLDAEIKELHE